MIEFLRRLWDISRGTRLRYLAAIVTTILATAVLNAIPYVMKYAVDIARPKKIDLPAHLVDWLGPIDSKMEILGFGAILVMGLTLGASIFTYLHTRWASISSEQISRDLRDQLYDHIQHIDYSRLSALETGDLLQRCTSDIETIRLFLSEQITAIARSTATLIVGICFMLPLGGLMTISATGLLPVLVVFSFLYFHRVRKYFKLSDEAEGEMTAVIHENLSGIRTVRAFANQQLEIDRFETVNTGYRDRWFRLIRVMSVYWAVSNLVIYGQRGICLAVGAWMLAYDPSFTVGDFFAFQLFVSLLLWPIQRLGRVVADMGKATVSISRINDILDTPVEMDGEIVETLPEPVGSIEFRDVEFSHDGVNPILKGLSFKVDPGQIVAIIGPSGTGKTTMVDLVLRLYDYSGGAILLDGVDIQQLPRGFVRTRIGVVRQTPFLFSRSVSENIGMGVSSADRDNIRSAASDAALHQTIETFDNGYETIVGEKGVTLSGGQRQRVALAREVLRNPEILVLDDGLSAVDAETETEICNALASRKGNRTTLIIAHRLSTLRLADRIVVIEDGRVSQEGTHDQLVAEGGLYQKLWQIQGTLDDELHRTTDREVQDG